MSQAPASPRPERAFGPRTLLGLVAPYRWHIAAGLALLFVTNALAQSIPLVIKRAVERLPDVDRLPDARRAMAHLAALLVGIAVVQAATRVLGRRAILSMSRRVERDLRGVLIRQLFRLDRAFYHRHHTGDLVARMTNDVTALSTQLGGGLVEIANTLCVFATALPVMLRIDPEVTAVSLLPYTLLALYGRLWVRKLYRWTREMQACLDGVSRVVHEDVAGVREIKAYDLIGRRSEVLAERSRELLRRYVILVGWRYSAWPIMGVAAGASLVINLWTAGTRVASGALTLGDLVAFQIYLVAIFFPTYRLMWFAWAWQRGKAAWHRIRDILREDPALPEAAAPGRRADGGATGRGALHIRGLTLALGDRIVLRDVHLDLQPGTVVGVTGRVGSGKTTLADVVAHLVPVPPGTVIAGGVDVVTLPSAEVRKQVAYAPQEPFLFATTIRENIALGLDDEDGLSAAERDREIREAAEAAGLGPDLAAMPAGLDTVVAERGASLSGGQRQRVALARALVARRPIVVLDDPLSAVDAATEERILRALRGFVTCSSVLLVSHRLRALEHTDVNVVLDEGRVVERGAHRELLAQGGVYAELWRHSGSARTA